jgi:hypothetical protein
MTDADVAARPRHTADGTATDGRKGIAYLRDHYVPAAVDDLLERFAVAGS